MIIHGCDDYQIDKHKKAQLDKYKNAWDDKYKKAMEIVNIFQENMKNGKETRVIVKNPALVVNGQIALLLEITIDDLSLDTLPEIMAKIRIFTDDRGFPYTQSMRTEISVYNLELYEEKENTEMKDFKDVCDEAHFTPKRINFRRKNEAYYTDVLWEDGTVTVVKLKEGDSFDEYAAFCAALAKKVFGSTNAVNKIVKKTACYPISKSMKKSIGRMKKANKEYKNCHMTTDMLAKEMEKLAKSLEGFSSDDSSEE